VRLEVIISAVCSVSYLLFFYSRCLPCPAICKSGGGTRAPVPMEWAPLPRTNTRWKSAYCNGFPAFNIYSFVVNFISLKLQHTF